MTYTVITDSMDDFVGLWEEKVMNLAIKQNGFIRMQLLVRDGEAMAMGTWTEQSKAEEFMALGPFKNLMASAKEMLTKDPTPTIWNLAAFAAR